MISYFEHDLESAHLIRQRDGYWQPPPNTRGSRIAGVLFANPALCRGPSQRIYPNCG